MPFLEDIWELFGKLKAHLRIFIEDRSIIFFSSCHGQLSCAHDYGIKVQSESVINKL